ncbi:hypothetical protein R1sor_017443 [Riccia sorocarpa]|uniref:Cytochrome b5 heme-binding domain-containing protein n=1 Tax=Riccia sorocarpa TaxID=122646 RepID=A0ABD3I7Z1_9MARC
MENILMSICVAIFLAVGLSVVVLYPAFSARSEHKRLSKSTAENAAVQTTEKRCYTAEEVSKHNSEKSVWLIIKDKIYDVTEYLNEHPGGESMLNNAGGENTKGFYGPQHPRWAYERLEDFYIGDLKQ